MLWHRRKDYVKTVLGRSDLHLIGEKKEREVTGESGAMGFRSTFVKETEPSYTVDVLENAVAALATLTAQHVQNADRVRQDRGIWVLLDLANFSHEAVEGEVVHANVAEALANVTQYNGREAGQQIMDVSRLLHLRAYWLICNRLLT
jgi:hypothetical protein